jgi:uncharacterized protein YaaQ
MFRTPDEIHSNLEKNNESSKEKEPQGNMPAKDKHKPVDWLLGVVLQEHDILRVTTALEKFELVVIQMASSGGFLALGNITLLIGVPSGILETVITTIRDNTRERVTYREAPVEEPSTALAFPVAIPIGGAVLFSLPVVKFEEF